MKRLISIAMIAVLTVSMISCNQSTPSSQTTSSGSSSTPVSTKTDVPSSSSNEVEVDKGLLDVAITLPATFFEGQTKEDIEKTQKEKGVKDITVNDDGSVTLKMTKSLHEELLAEMFAATTENLDGMANSEEFPSIQKIEYSDDLTKITVTADRTEFEKSMQGLSLMGINLACGMYHMFTGEDTTFLIDVVDADTGEVFKTYPEN